MPFLSFRVKKSFSVTLISIQFSQIHYFLAKKTFRLKRKRGRGGKKRERQTEKTDRKMGRGGKKRGRQTEKTDRKRGREGKRRERQTEKTER